MKLSRNGVPQPLSGVPPPETAVPSPKVVAPPPGDAGKIIKIVAIRGQIQTLKYIKFYFGWGADPDPGAFSASPDPLAGFKGPTSKGRRGIEERRWEGEGREREGRR